MVLIWFMMVCFNMGDDGFDLFFRAHIDWWVSWSPSTWRWTSQSNTACEWLKVSSRKNRSSACDKWQGCLMRSSPAASWSSVPRLFAMGQVDSHCSAESTIPAKLRPAAKKLLWQHQLAACAALRAKNEEDIEMTKQKPWSWHGFWYGLWWFWHGFWHGLWWF